MDFDLSEGTSSGGGNEKCVRMCSMFAHRARVERICRCFAIHSTAGSIRANTEIGSYFKGGREYVKTTVRAPVLTFAFGGETKSKEFGALAVEEAKALASKLRAGALVGYSFVSLKWVTFEIESETETSMEQRGS